MYLYTHKKKNVMKSLNHNNGFHLNMYIQKYINGVIKNQQTIAILFSYIFYNYLQIFYT